LRCFFDDRSLEPGDNAAKEMLEAMQTAKYGIVILSAGFFEREWCMKELQTFVLRGRILPVFFGTFNEVQRARNAAVAGRTWETFKYFVRSENEYRSVAEINTPPHRAEIRIARWVLGHSHIQSQRCGAGAAGQG
jgi:hypothetical protein